MMNRTVKVVIAGAIGLAMFSGMPASATAQGQGGQGQITLDFDSADVREALRALFRTMGVSYSIAPAVQGTVTVHMHGMPFETALQNILKQVDATYRIVGGVYEIVPRDHEPEDPRGQGQVDPIPNNNHVVRKYRPLHADPLLLAMLIAESQTNFSLAPEQSTVINTPNFGSGGNGGFGSNGYGGGSNSGSGMNGGFQNNGNGNGNGNRNGGGPGGRG
jgi:type II secretory pathway component GspD/PulD (secretin)